MTTRDGDLFIEWAPRRSPWPWSKRRGSLWARTFDGYHVWLGSTSCYEWRLWWIVRWFDWLRRGGV